MQQPDEDIFTPAVFNILKEQLADIVDKKNKEDVVEQFQKHINDLPLFLKAVTINETDTHQCQTFFQIALNKYQQHLNENQQYEGRFSVFLANEALQELKAKKSNKIPRHRVRSPGLRPHSVHGTDLRRPPNSIYTNQKLNLDSLAQAPEPDINRWYGSLSGRNQPTPIHIPHINSLEQYGTLVKVNLRSNSNNTIDWFVKNVTLTTPEGESFNLPIKSNKKLYTIQIHHKQPCNNPDLLIVLCDKTSSHADFLQELKNEKKLLFFLRTDINESANKNIMTEKKFEKLKLNGKYFEIGTTPSPMGQLQTIIEQIPRVYEDQKDLPAPLEKKEGCDIM